MNVRGMNVRGMNVRTKEGRKECWQGGRERERGGERQTEH